MATVLPFAGMLPQQELAEKVAAPPYDVISSEEARVLAKGNPYSFLHINKPEIDLSPDIDTHSDAVYEKGRENIARFLDENIFVQDSSPAFYLYRQTLGQHSQTGLVALVSADDYENNVIKKHELTRPEKENDRVRHMQAVQAQTGPVFLTFQSDQQLSGLMNNCAHDKPRNDFVSDGVRHQLWSIPDADTQQQISQEFEKISDLFVADGHHRSAAAVRYRSLCREQNAEHQGDEPYNYFMAVLFPHDELNILGYHRVIKDIGDYDSQTFLEAIRKDFTVTACGNDGMPECAGQLGLYLDGQWYRVAAGDWHDEMTDIVAQLDVSVLQDRILSPLLGIDDPRTDARIDFIGGIKGQAALEDAVDSGRFSAAFACYPINIESLMAIARQGSLMPPKSTWFEPKLKSGLVMHYLG